MAKKNNLKTITKVPRFEWDETNHKPVHTKVTYQAITYDGEANYLWYRKFEQNGVEYTLPKIEVPNEPFEAELCYVTYVKGRSACNAVFENEAGEKFHVFMSDFDNMIRHMRDGKIKSTFIYVKKGSNYGLQMV